MEHRTKAGTHLVGDAGGGSAAVCGLSLLALRLLAMPPVPQLVLQLVQESGLQERREGFSEIRELHRAVPSHGQTSRRTSDVTSHVTHTLSGPCRGGGGRGEGRGTGCSPAMCSTTVGTRGEVLAAIGPKSHHDDRSGMRSELARGSKDAASCRQQTGVLMTTSICVSSKQPCPQNSEAKSD